MKIKKINPLPLTFPILFPIGLIFLLFVFFQWYVIDKNKTTLNINNKQKGAHVFGRLDSTNLKPFHQSNIEWITLVPFAGQKDIDSPEISYVRGDSLAMVRRDARWKNHIEAAHAAGFKVFLKPHIWLRAPSNGKWRSDIFPTNEANWKLWQEDYRKFILHYAKIAQQNKVEMFCIGTELSRLTVEKPDFWKDFIQEVKGIYTGKITYAANWYNEYEKITFWKELDYIGIQAYFPLVNNEYPNVQQISKGWKKHFPTMKAIHKKYNRQILFTEMGYKSTSDSAIEPWQWIDYMATTNSPVSMDTQANCYEAFFNTVWHKKWFAGVHIWQLRSDFVEGRGKSHLDFTPQGKPAARVIAKGFEQ